MADEGEKTCPLCAEEMDLTDQQLKPCKCGYDICVWCWHHIMDMAEKDGTEGRCPACRTPYNKKKIVETSSKCERLVAEMSVEKKQKSQKGKTKTFEGRKQLSSVRVIQRNLVYIVGLPLDLADEDLLQRKEYFGQYGKVLKVSISRTAAGTIQHFPNNTCSVYITYSKEDEAVRSIQSVHGFVLEGRPLRACFGTTKYCHAWLRSMPCTNPDCLYLHEFGSQEDSFTKDETISEYTRGRVQQVTGAMYDTQRRSGNVLPPAADDYSNNSTSWGKPVDKSTTNDPANSLKGSPPNSSSGRPLPLPAAASWGTRASNSQPSAANLVSSNGPSKPKVDTSSTTSNSKAAVTDSSQGDETLKKRSEEKPTANRKAKPDPSNDKNESSGLSTYDEERIHKLSSAMSSIRIDTNHGLHSCDDEKEKPPEPLVSDEAAVNEAEADLVSFNNQRLKDPEVVTHTHSNNSHSFPLPVNRYSPELDDKTTAVTNGGHNTALDLGENSIISNILSMDFDPWDESLASPQNLAKLLGNGDKQGPGSKKTHSCNQSRFSFAREDDGCVDRGLNDSNGFSSFSFEEFGSAAAGYSSLSTNKISVSRSQISAPPGFTGHVKAPPPGFTSNDNLSGHHMFDSSSLLRKVNQAPAAVYNNGSIGELEFMDPAILAVGGRVPLGGHTPPGLDTRSNFSRLETENQLRLLVQRSFTPQSHNFSTDSYGLPTRTVDHNNRSAYQQVGSLTNFQQQRMPNNLHWGDNGWNEVQNRNDIAMAELLRNERLGGFDKYYSGYEDAKFRVLSSGDLYNRTFGV